MLHKCIKCSQNRGETTIVNSAKTLHFVKIGGMVKALIWSVTLHEAETWTMTKEHVKQIKASEMWIWRRLERISWTKHRTNEEVLKKVEEKRSLMDIIRTRQKNWIGHIVRGNSLQREIMEGRMEWKTGRHRQKLMDWIMEDAYCKI